MSPALPPTPRRPRPVHVALHAAVALAIALPLGCAEETKRTPLTAPQEGRYAIRGQVRLTAVLKDEVNGLLGDRVVDDADDVRIHVHGPGGYHDSVLTRDGVFVAGVDALGFYRLSYSVVRGDTVARVDVVVADDDTTEAGLMTIGSPTGIITTYPNPFDQVSGVGIEVSLIEPQHVETFYNTLYGATVWSFAQHVPDSFFVHVHWTGIDPQEQPLPDGPYWAVLHANGFYSYSLVFKQTPRPTGPSSRAVLPATRSRPRPRHAR